MIEKILLSSRIKKRLPCIHKARKDNSSDNTNLRLMKIEQTKQKERRNYSSSVTNISIILI
jgi:hypothetical protein